MENSLLFGPFIVDAPAKVGIICAALLVLLFVVNSACKEPELFWGGAVGFLIFCAFSVVAVFMAEDMEIRNGYMFWNAVFFFFWEFFPRLFRGYSRGASRSVKLKRRFLKKKSQKQMIF